MLSVNKLEKIIELEEQLRAEYQNQLDTKTTEIDRLSKRQSELETTIATQQASLDQQLQTITELSGKANANQKVEQLNRELNNRSDNLTDEVTELKARVKSLQKDLAQLREDNKTLTQFDPARMKKNLDAGKKKLAEKTRANEVLQKSLSTVKGENVELQTKVAELEAKLADLEPAPDSDLDSELDGGVASGVKSEADTEAAA